MITISFKAQRNLLLTAIYVEAKANPTTFVDTRPQAKRLDIDDELLDGFLSYYIQKGLAISEGLGDGHFFIALTPYGIDFVETGGLLTKTE